MEPPKPLTKKMEFSDRKGKSRAYDEEDGDEA